MGTQSINLDRSTESLLLCGAVIAFASSASAYDRRPTYPPHMITRAQQWQIPSLVCFDRIDPMEQLEPLLKEGTSNHDRNRFQVDRFNRGPF